MKKWYRLLYPALFGAGVAASCVSPKIRRGFRARRGLSARMLANCGGWTGRPVWFHIASSGELEQCLPILDALKKRQPETQIFLSYFSPTAERALALEKERRRKAGLSVPWDYSDYSPHDFRGTVREFVDALKPSVFVAIHREIWPGVLEECGLQGIPCCLFAAYLAPTMQGWLRWYSDWLSSFAFIGTTQEQSARLFRDALPRSVRIAAVGDPRIERVFLRKEMRSRAGWGSFFDGSQCLIFASLWPKDFAQVTFALDEALGAFPGLRIVLVPHEPHGPFVAKLMEWFKARGQPARLWSAWLEMPDRTSHLVVDGVGFLAELYEFATAVFVGGSFRARVHNVLEPAGYGKPVFTGPFIENSGEAMEMWEKGLLSRASDGRELAREIVSLLGNPENWQARSRGLEDYVASRRGAGERYAEIIIRTAYEK